MRARLFGRHRRRNASLDVLCGGLLLAAVAVTGCGGPDAVADQKPPGAVLAALREIPDLLTAAGSSRASTAVQMASGGTRITIHGEGVFDYRKRTGELRVTLPEDPSAERSEPVTEVFVPGSLYMKNRGAGVPAGKWVRMAIAALPDGNLVTGGATDPITAAALLRGARSAEDLGEVEVGGETLRLYRGVADIAEAAEAAPDEHGREQLRAAVHGFTDTAVPFDVYVDAEGLLRQVRHRFSFAVPRAAEAPGRAVADDPPAGAAAGAGHDAAGGDAAGREAGGDDGTGPGREAIEVTSTTVLHDFGAPVDIRLPAAEDIFTGTVVTAGL